MDFARPLRITDHKTCTKIAKMTREHDLDTVLITYIMYNLYEPPTKIKITIGESEHYATVCHIQQSVTINRIQDASLYQPLMIPIWKNATFENMLGNIMQFNATRCMDELRNRVEKEILSVRPFNQLSKRDLMQIPVTHLRHSTHLNSAQKILANGQVTFLGNPRELRSKTFVCLPEREYIWFSAVPGCIAPRKYSNAKLDAWEIKGSHYGPYTFTISIEKCFSNFGSGKQLHFFGIGSKDSQYAKEHTHMVLVTTEPDVYKHALPSFDITAKGLPIERTITGEYVWNCRTPTPNYWDNLEIVFDTPCMQFARDEVDITVNAHAEFCYPRYHRSEKANDGLNCPDANNVTTCSQILQGLLTGVSTPTKRKAIRMGNVEESPKKKHRTEIDIIVID
jgi:hypothetical protein